MTNLIALHNHYTKNSYEHRNVSQAMVCYTRKQLQEEIGTTPTETTRKRKSDIQSELLSNYCKEEITIEELIDKDNLFAMKYLPKILSIKSILAPDRKEKTDLYLIIGEPGIGKTTFATKLSKNYYIKTANSEKWWDDDFYGWFSPAELFNLADSKKHIVPIKGGFSKFTSKAIVITSNKKPEHWWKNEVIKKYDMRALLY
ncbi:unnamed protein product [Wuchereria bancrofti]|uniref:Helicase superfamily 3 single-stranded DNA/RNA virus domain-containing protein n=1 Tax=Wuchereria bancrofti TaxID=6293 RepID=A0A3P7EYE1_WUCBA|nr:unnamed protein product [Wuchereria bancrofti]